MVRCGRVPSVLVTLSVVVVLDKRWSRTLMVLLPCAVVLVVLAAVLSVLDVRSRTRGGSLGDSRSILRFVDESSVTRCTTWSWMGTWSSCGAGQVLSLVGVSTSSTTTP